MWTITGPFDGEEDKLAESNTTKLLRPGNSYILSRKSGPLVVKHKSISRKHLVFEVGECSEEDIENPDFIPKLTIQNPTSQTRKCTHADGTEFILNKDGSTVLKDEDRIWVLHDTALSVRWRKVACCCPPTVTDINPSDCAKLGVHMLSKPHPKTSYHLTPTLTLTPAIATSLLNASTFVKPTWLAELIAQYSPLESPDPCREYHLPSVAKHRPVFSPALPSSLKNYRSWEPNEARILMLQGYRVLFVGERGREASEDYKELVKQGGGAYECCAVQGGRKTLHDVLAKAQGKDAKIALVADETAMVAAVGQDEWDGIREEAASFGLRFINADKLVEAVVHVDLSRIDCSTPQGESTQSGVSLPDVVFNTHPDEPSIPPSHGAAEPLPEAELAAQQDSAPATPRRKLVRRTAPRGPSVEPVASTSTANTTSAPESAPGTSEPPKEEQFFKPRRPLVRRNLPKANENAIVGIGDTSTTIDSVSSAADPDPKPMEDTLLIRRPFNLKRRFGSATPAPQPAPPPPPSQLVIEKPSGEEPPHKKFKALFEESDPDRIATQLSVTQADTGGNAVSAVPSSQTQSESVARTQPRTRELASVPEDEELDVQPTGPPNARESQKRKTRDTDDDVHMADADSTRPTKRRASSKELAASQSQAPSNRDAGPKVFTNAANKPPSTQKAGGTSQKPSGTSQKARGAASGKPDTDEAFLKAVASTKRGKKHEDDFDREFNNLRISKPEVQRVDPEEQWKVLDDFGDDRDVRGNFMVVVEMDLVRKDRREGASSAVTHGSGRRDWEGRPNFKKFKKKATGERPKPIELVPSNEDDILGFKDEDDDKTSFPRSQSQRRFKNESSSPVKPKSQPEESRKRQRDSDSEVEEAIAPKSQRTQSKLQALQFKASQSKASQAKAAQPRTTRQKQKSTLFVESEDEDDAAMSVDKNISQNKDEDSDEDISAHSTMRSQSQRRSQWRRDLPPEDDDSDNDMVLKGFGSSRSQRTQRR